MHCSPAAAAAGVAAAAAAAGTVAVGFLAIIKLSGNIKTGEFKLRYSCKQP